MITHSKSKTKNLNEELLTEIDCAINQDKLGFSRIDKASSLLLIDSLVSKFSFDANKVYLWESKRKQNYYQL